MRTKDDNKQEALFLATIKLVNEIGFAASSVSKIAKEAGVSPATLYVYFKNKEDLLVSTYIEIKKSMGAAILEGFDEELPLQDIFQKVWLNAFVYVAANKDEFRYTEQFSNSPYMDQMDMLKLKGIFTPFERAIQKGIEQKIIKDVNMDMIGAFLFHPITFLANSGHCKTFDPSEANIKMSFHMAWDAVRFGCCGPGQPTSEIIPAG